MERRFGMALYKTTEVGKMMKYQYYSIMFFLCCIWCNIATSTEAKVLLIILGVFYMIDMIVSAYKGE